MFCPKCGAQNVDTDTFCQNCGSPLHNAQKNHNNNALIITISITAAVILIICAVVICMSMRKPDNTETAYVPKSTEIPADESETYYEEEIEYSSNLIDNMNAEEKRKLSVFLSNLSEAHLYEYGFGDPYENFDLVSFAFNHHLINANENVEYIGDYMRISTADVDYTLQRFFGKTVPHSDAYGEEVKWECTDGYFRMPAASGESVAYFTVPTEMTDNGDKTYTVNFRVFWAGESLDSRDWYSFSIDQANAVCEYCYSGTAVVRDKVFNGKNSYEIITYTTDNPY